MIAFVGKDLLNFIEHLAYSFGFHNYEVIAWSLKTGESLPIYLWIIMAASWYCSGLDILYYDLQPW